MTCTKISLFEQITEDTDLDPKTAHMVRKAQNKQHVIGVCFGANGR